MAQLFAVAGVEHAAQDQIVYGHAEKTEADHQHAGDRSRLERDVERGREAAGPRRIGGTDVGAHRDVHPDVARDARENRADEEADRDVEAEDDPQEDADDGADDGDRGVLAIEIGGRAFLNRRSNVLHLLVASLGVEDGADRPRAIGQRADPAEDDKNIESGHENVLPKRTQKGDSGRRSLCRHGGMPRRHAVAIAAPPLEKPQDSA